MERCPVCNGRTISAPEGIKCMNSSCDGSKLEAVSGEDQICRCGKVMTYTGEDSWGMRVYQCIYCGATKRDDR